MYDHCDVITPPIETVNTTTGKSITRTHIDMTKSKIQDKEGIPPVTWCCVCAVGVLEMMMIAGF